MSATVDTDSVAAIARLPRAGTAGAGIARLTAAYRFQQAGWEVISVSTATDASISCALTG